MTETKKRTRAPKQLTREEIAQQVEGLALTEKIDIFLRLKDGIEEEKKKMQEKLELINTNVK